MLIEANKKVFSTQFVFHDSIKYSISYQSLPHSHANTGLRAAVWEATLPPRYFSKVYLELWHLTIRSPHQKNTVLKITIWKLVVTLCLLFLCEWSPWGDCADLLKPPRTTTYINNSFYIGGKDLQAALTWRERLERANVKKHCEQ